MDESMRSLMLLAIDQTICVDDFERLQDAIEQSDEVRNEYLAAVRLCESLSDIAGEEEESLTQSAEISTFGSQSHWSLRSLQLMIAAATAVILVGGVAFWFGHQDGSRRQKQMAVGGEATDTNSTPESVIAGHATLRRSVDVRWEEKSGSYREGDVLPAGVLQLDQGLAEIDFFCGVTLAVFNAALNSDELQNLYEQGRPLGY